MAYWDMGSTDSRNYGLPSSLTDKYIELDGEVLRFIFKTQPWLVLPSVGIRKAGLSQL